MKQAKLCFKSLGGGPPAGASSKTAVINTAAAAAPLGDATNAPAAGQMVIDLE